MESRSLYATGLPCSSISLRCPSGIFDSLVTPHRLIRLRPSDPIGSMPSQNCHIALPRDASMEALRPYVNGLLGSSCLLLRRFLPKALFHLVTCAYSKRRPDREGVRSFCICALHLSWPCQLRLTAVLPGAFVYLIDFESVIPDTATRHMPSRLVLMYRAISLRYLELATASQVSIERSPTPGRPSTS